MRRNGAESSHSTNLDSAPSLKPTPWGIVPKGEWTDHEDRLAAEWLQKQGILVSVETAGQAVQTAARDHPYTRRHHKRRLRRERLAVRTSLGARWRGGRRSGGRTMAQYRAFLRVASLLPPGASPPLVVASPPLVVASPRLGVASLLLVV